ncbi:Transcription-silencing protein Clr2 [Penicillium bovifimosum]|uniref:Transcription-silencing protein Clr2 n=1 Tax=Penicillium bovifimosum TaxID=126998 RepID=A0A9W9L8E4_9EURO|nr:Transcription-silencing protein Clr2 [Penicillium bovifimosum]KAJ5142681.1 Transcription-silencing protein Clr2 [Penicillium bovifimosum]
MSSFDDNMVVIPMTAASDGDMSTWPDSPYTERDDYSWRLNLAENWLKDAGTYEEGVTHIIEKLPDGYCLFERPRVGGRLVKDCFLFGHPSGKYFRTRIAFLPHFLALVKGTLDSCPCKPCATYRKMKEKGSAVRPVARTGVPPPSDNTRQPTDAEGPDYWRTYVMKLLDNGEIDEAVEQPLNFDWVLTHEWITDYCVKLIFDPAYVPRRGELVLWIWDGLEDGSLTLNPATGRYEILGNDDLWRGVPYWRAGVVTQTPENDTHTWDIVETPDHPRGLSYSGFRVETLPDPLGTDKSYSKHYTYVPLRNIRPFNAWQIFLKDQDRDKAHPSIENAMTVMSSWSVVSKYHIVGKDRNCSIHCQGIFIGSELLVVGDTIRLKPEGFQHSDLKSGKIPKITDVMVITKISLRLIECIDDDPEQLAKHYAVLLSGLVYTNDPSRVRKSRTFPDPTGDDNPKPLTPNQAITAFRQVSICDYGPWYKMANGRNCNVTPQVVIGRCYEPLAAELLFGAHGLDYDLSGVMEGRNFSAQVDARIPEGNTWFWGDCRVETLGVTELCGIECGRTAPQRDDPKKWQAIMRMARGESSAALRRQAQIPASEPPARAASSSSVSKGKSKGGFAQVSQTSKMVGVGLGGETEENDDDYYDDDSDMTDEESADIPGPPPSAGHDVATESDSMDDLA